MKPLLIFLLIQDIPDTGEWREKKWTENMEGMRFNFLACGCEWVEEDFWAGGRTWNGIDFISPYWLKIHNQGKDGAEIFPNSVANKPTSGVGPVCPGERISRVLPLQKGRNFWMLFTRLGLCTWSVPGQTQLCPFPDCSQHSEPSRAWRIPAKPGKQRFPLDQEIPPLPWVSDCPSPQSPPSWSQR